MLQNDFKLLVCKDDFFISVIYCGKKNYESALGEKPIFEEIHGYEKLFDYRGKIAFFYRSYQGRV